MVLSCVTSEKGYLMSSFHIFFIFEFRFSGKIAFIIHLGISSEGQTLN